MTFDLCASTRKLVSQSLHHQELVAFATWLEEQHYTDFVGDKHLRRLAFILPRFSGDEGSYNYSAEQLEAIFGAERSPQSRFHRFASTRRAYQRFLVAAGRLRVQPSNDRFSELRADYARYILELRGLSASSRYQHAHTVADFLVRCLTPQQPLCSLCRADIERYIQLRSKEVTRHSLQHTVAHIRAFLRYLYDMEYVPARLDALDTPRTYRGELPPREVPWTMVQTLLASIDKTSKAGWRDYCILHLIANYGMRPSEVVALRLDSIDWNTGILHIYQRKTSTELDLPLSKPTLQILKDYLQHDRIHYGHAYCELFLRARCPFGPLEHFAINDILEKRAREAGLTVFGGNAYRLRHTFAMHLLRHGVGVKAIGDVLGHRSLESTCAYLRLDTTMLRGVALKVPGDFIRKGDHHE